MLTSEGGKSSCINPIPRVELLKVHGSINLFRDPDGPPTGGVRRLGTNPPEGYTRAIAAPGEQKFQTVADNPDPAAVAREAEDRARRL